MSVKIGEYSGKLFKFMSDYLGIEDTYLAAESGLTESAIRNMYTLDVVPREFGLRLTTAMRLMRQDFQWLQIVLVEITQDRSSRIFKIEEAKRQMAENKIQFEERLLDHENEKIRKQSQLHQRLEKERLERESEQHERDKKASSKKRKKLKASGKRKVEIDTSVRSEKPKAKSSGDKKQQIKSSTSKQSSSIKGKQQSSSKNVYIGSKKSKVSTSQQKRQGR